MDADGKNIIRLSVDPPSSIHQERYRSIKDHETHLMVAGREVDCFSSDRDGNAEIYKMKRMGKIKYV